MIEVYPSPSQVARGRAVTGCRSPFAVLIEAAENSWSESVDPALDSGGAGPQTSWFPKATGRKGIKTPVESEPGIDC